MIKTFIHQVSNYTNIFIKHLSLKIFKLKLSWNEYLSSYIVNYTDQVSGKSYKNSAEHGAIISKEDGAVLASTPGLFSLEIYKTEVNQEDGNEKVEVEINEFENLVDTFKNNGVSTKVGGIRFNHIKYQNLRFQEKKILYLKRTGGGAVVVETNKAFVIGVFNSSKKMVTNHGETSIEEPQIFGVVNVAAEKLQEVLLANNL